MSSVGSLLVGQPAKINADLLTGAGLVDSVNGLTGDVSVVGTAPGLNTAIVGQIVTLTNTGVTSAVAGTGITVSGATGAVTITRQPGFIQYNTATTLIGASPYPTQLAPTTFGAGFTPAVAGFYAVQMNYQPGVAATVWGAGDVLQVGVRRAGVPLAVGYVNWFGPSDPSALETIESQTLLLNLDAGVAYDFYWWAEDNSGTLDLGGGSIVGTIYAP